MDARGSSGATFEAVWERFVGEIGTSPKDIAISIAVIVLPCCAVLIAVTRQSKTVAALAQMGSTQTRDDMRDRLTKAAIEVDQKWFIAGVGNVGFSSYLLGAFPAAYYMYFTPKIVSLIFLRWLSFRKKKQHFLLWDFCYWANFLCLFYVWIMPTSPAVFQCVFIMANGPLAWSVLAFNHAMIFHSYAHLTSVIVHVSPLVLSYGLRWYAAPLARTWPATVFAVCDPTGHVGESDPCQGVHYVDLVQRPLLRFYLWWLVIYYIWIFVALGKYIEQRGYQTLWDRILQMKPVGPLLQRLLKGKNPDPNAEPNRCRKLFAQLVYMFIHLIFSTATMFVAALLWYSQPAHFCFMACICFSTVKNASKFYFEVFESHYKTAIEDGSSRNVLGKKIVAASPFMDQFEKPLIGSRGC